MSAAAPSLTRRRRRFARYNLSARIGGGIVLAFVLVAVTAPMISPYDPLASDWMGVLQPPSLAHPMGTDDLGRDVLSRAIWGAQTSLIAGVASVMIALAIGVPLGIAAGYFRGWIDVVVTRLADTLLACPQVMLAIALAMFLGGSLLNASIAIGISTVPVFVRLARAKTIEQTAAVYIEAAISVGNPVRRLLFVHLLPNIVPPLIVQAALATAVAIIAEAGLSFLGLGRELPAPSWGSMLTVGKDYIATAPWLSIWPGLCICLAVIGFNLLGDGLRRALDPRS
ncbi:ABC transporter permease [Mesorhizobium sp. IMUNJ 23232]|uniref:ABC transporter permease n=1 Tax=Mesorhizobium sp. IMUNJ 23232 TaxID=3376064 RepID=UPI0037B9BF16